MLLTTLYLLFATPTAAVQIHPLGRNDLCVDVRGANFAKDTPVQLWECNGTPAQNWEWGLHDVDMQWRVVGTNWCLRFEGAGDRNIKMGIMDCNGTAYLNSWVLNTTHHMIENYGRYGRFALDVTDGGLYNGNQLQLFDANPCDPNQLWSW